MGVGTDLLLRKLEDALRQARHRPSFLGFLDESQAAQCREALSRRKGGGWLFWGGHEDAERVMLGFFPDYMDPDPAAFPIAAVTLTYRKEDALRHRDFLGSFMGLGVERSVVGDILVGEGRCVAFVKEEMGRYFADTITKIGRVGVKAVLGAEGPLPGGRSYQDVAGVVASARLDCLTALLTRTSREKAAGMIGLGLVQQNHRENLSPAARVAEGDVLSVRGHGRFIIDRLGPKTQKGRLSVRCRKCR